MFTKKNLSKLSGQYVIYNERTQTLIPLGRGRLGKFKLVVLKTLKLLLPFLPY